MDYHNNYAKDFQEIVNNQPLSPEDQEVFKPQNYSLESDTDLNSSNEENSSSSASSIISNGTTLGSSIHSELKFRKKKFCMQKPIFWNF